MWQQTYSNHLITKTYKLHEMAHKSMVLLSLLNEWLFCLASLCLDLCVCVCVCASQIYKIVSEAIKTKKCVCNGSIIFRYQKLNLFFPSKEKNGRKAKNENAPQRIDDKHYERAH